MRRFSQYDIMTIWAFLRRESYSKVAARYDVTPSTIRCIVEGRSYKRETREVDSELIANAKKGIEKRFNRSPDYWITA